MFYWRKKLIVECTKLMFTREYWWILPICFALGFSAPSFFTNNYWIMLLFGVLSYPLALLVAMSALRVKNNKKFMHNVIEHIVESKQKE